MFDPSWNDSNLICCGKIQNMRDADSRGLSFPSWEESRAQGSDLLEKHFIYEGICADLYINTNNGKLLSHHKPYYDNMFLITVFGLPVAHTILILCYEHGVLIGAHGIYYQRRLIQIWCQHRLIFTRTPLMLHFGNFINETYT